MLLPTTTYRASDFIAAAGRLGVDVVVGSEHRQALADVDHLAILHAIWAAETTPAREQRYRELLTAALPPEHRQELSHQAKWL